MEKKITWLTSDSFLDVDIPILLELADTYSIHWIIIFSKNRVVTYNQEQIMELFSEKSITIDFIFFSNRLRSVKTFRQNILLAKKIKSSDAQLVYCNYLGIPYFFPILLVVVGKSNVIYAIHDVVDHLNVKKRIFISLYKKFIFHYFQNFHLFSNTQNNIFKLKHPAKNTFLAPLYLKSFGSTTKTARKDKIQFLFFGSLRGNKGVEYLLQAGNELFDKYPNQFIIKIAGKCENWNQYDKYIKHKQAFDLHLYPIENSEVPDLFGSSHYLILPYLDVTQSGPLMLAYNYNVPVVASRLDGFSEYIDDMENGYLFETKNASDLCQKMELCLQNIPNGEYNNMLKKLDKYVQENISLHKICNKYVQSFDTFFKDPQN